MEKILVLDFGGQYNQLIARRVRENGVYAEIKPYNKISVNEIKAENYKGIIFTGGPNSVYDESSPHYEREILDLDIPIGQLLKMALCYLDAGQPQGTDQMLMAYFGNNIAKDIDRIKNDRISHSKGNTTNEN